jgi:formate-dependent nitrite reductase cytochrome c552 subunit
MGHARHFLRLFLLIAIVVVAFLSVRAQVVPKDFGTLGHFRASAIPEEAAREPRHLGSEVCADCHDEISTPKAAGKHSIPQCENCHGPGMIHVKIMSEDSIDKYPDKIKNNPKGLRVISGIQECKWCHLKTFERPTTLKYITSVPQHFADHGRTFTPLSKCIDCHNPHTTVVK